MTALTSKLGDTSGANRARADMTEYVNYLKARGLSHATVACYVMAARALIRFLESQSVRDLRAVTAAHLEAYKQHVMTCGRFSVNGAYTVLRALRSLFDYLERNGQLLVNPIAGLQMPRLGVRLPRGVPTYEEVDRMLAAPDLKTGIGVRDRAVLEVLYATGMRGCELRALEMIDVDLANGCVRINHGKGGRDRVVPLGRDAMACIKAYARDVRPRTARPGESRLFMSCVSRAPLDTQSLRLLVGRHARAAGIERRITPHSLRHACATHMLAAGADVVHLQQLLGHASLDTTQIYTRVVPADLKQAHAACHPAERLKLPASLPAPTALLRRKRGAH